MNEILPQPSKPETSTTHYPPNTSSWWDSEFISPPSSPDPTPIQTDVSYNVQRKGEKRRKITSSSLSVAPAKTIDILPDDILLQIFDFCQVDNCRIQWPFYPVLIWHRLTYVCRTWRRIIFSSPSRLDLRLLCKRGTPVRKNLGIWPAFPIIVDYFHHTREISSSDEDNIIAALEHPDRVRCLKLSVTSSLLETVAMEAQEPFPILTLLRLSSEGEIESTLPSSFLGESAPLLREIYLEGIPFPNLPTLLSSASNLVVLSLLRIPDNGYISPKAMVTSLAALTRLNSLSIGFQSPRANGERVPLAPPTRIVLPVLTDFDFLGASEYLEDLVAQVDAPLLTYIKIQYFNQLAFHVPQLFRFIGQTQIIDHTMDAHIRFDDSYANITFHQNPVNFSFRISCQGLDWQVSHFAEVLSQFSAVLSNMRHLTIDAYYLQASWRDDMDHFEWLALLRQFTTVESLRVLNPIAAHVANALKEVTAEMAPEILPALRLLYLADGGGGRVEEFITARRLSGLPPVTRCIR